MRVSTNAGRAIGRVARGRAVLNIALLAVGMATGPMARVAIAQDALPRVHVIATGGTIASRGGEDGPLTGDQLVRAVPELARVAELSVEQLVNVGSSQITPAIWRRLARRIAEQFRADPALAGVVVTHGTDTMEETAYFLQLTVADGRPVVVTGSMRPSDAIGAEGPANLYNAVRLAASDEGRGRGVVVLMNDEVHAPREVTKTNTSRLDAFVSPRVGAIGVTDPDGIRFYRWPTRPANGPLVEPERIESLPRVDVVYSYAGADGTGIDAAVAAGARGIVLASVGRGNLPAAQREAVRRAVERGVVVAVSSRTGSGRVPVEPGRLPAKASPAGGLLIGAGDLNPQKARVLLMLALARGIDPAELPAVFRSY